MIKPDMIPNEVVEAAAMVLHANNEVFHDVSWDDLGDYDQEAYREEARAAIAAALNAWPDGCVGESECGWHRYIELPLPQEKSDE
jgi:hypothetical protein